MREVLDLDEVEAASARIVIERTPGEDGELEAILETEADDLLDEMDTEERKANIGPWRE